MTNALVPAVLVDGCRTPFLKAGTAFADLTSYDLARLALADLRRRTGLAPDGVDRVIMGTVISNIQTSNVAREAMLAAGFDERTPAFTVTQACISANAAIAAGAELIATGRARAVVVGGTESMSDIPIRFRKRFRQKLVASQKYRGLLDWLGFLRGLRPSDLLPEIPSITEYSTGRTMGQDCDRLAARIGVGRQEQDQFAARSHSQAAEAAGAGLLSREIAPVRLPPKFKQVAADNGVRRDSTPEKLAALKPAFVKPYGTVTAGNASFLTDGAAAVLIMAEDEALARGYRPKAYLRDWTFVAQDPGEELLLGPAYATARLLAQVDMTLDAIDVFEFHEAFAGQVLANLECMASKAFAAERLGRDQPVGEVPLDKLNRWGGSLSLGHPFGATGARLVHTAANRLIHEDGRFALVAACAAGAMGHAMLLERHPAAEGGAS